MRRRLLTPTNWVYILAHGLLVVFGYHLATQNGPVRVGIGSSLIATGVTGWVVFVYMLLSQSVTERVRIVTEFGLTNAFQGRSVRIKSEYDKRLADACESIDIMGFGLKTLREDYRQEFARWKEKANVRILMLDPTFPREDLSYATERDTEERDDVGSIRADVDRFIAEVGPLVGLSGRHQFEIRLYRCLPSLNIFRVDDELFWGPYLIGQPSRSSPTFIAKKGGVLFKVIAEHFEAIWIDPKLSIPIAQYHSASRPPQ